MNLTALKQIVNIDNKSCIFFKFAEKYDTINISRKEYVSDQTEILSHVRMTNNM